MDDWLWTPLLDPDQYALALGGVVLLLAFGVLAMWPTRFAGEVSRAERARLGRIDPAGALLVWGVWLAPVLLALGAGLLFFPVAPPQTVLLSSRSRPVSAEGADAWAAKWIELVKDHPGDGIDLGPTVDAVCDRLLEAPGEPSWRPDDPTLRRRVRETLAAVLAETEPAAVAPTAVRHRAEARLPRWLVETVELAALRAQGQRANVRRYVALVAERGTEAGPAWGVLEPYLQTGVARLRAPEVEVARQADRGGVRLEQVVEAGHQPGRGWVVRCVLAVPAGAADAEVQLRLHVAGGKASAPRGVPLPASGGPGLVMRVVVFPDFGAAARPTALVQAGQPPVSRPVPNHRAGVPVLVRLRVADPDRWAKTWDVLTRDLAFAAWRERMREWGHPLDDLTFARDRGDVVIDGLSASGSVWVYAAARGAEPLPRVVVGPAMVEPVRAARTGAGDVPGQFSWDRLPLRALEAAPQCRPGDGFASAGRRPLVKALEEGAIVRSGAEAAPLVTHHREPSGESTHFAFDPAGQDALLPLGEPARAAAVWTALLNALRRSAAGENVGRDEDAPDAPQLVLESADLQGYRASALARLVPLLVGLLIYAAVVARGIAGAPARRSAAGEGR